MSSLGKRLRSSGPPIGRTRKATNTSATAHFKQLSPTYSNSKATKSPNSTANARAVNPVTPITSAKTPKKAYSIAASSEDGATPSKLQRLVKCGVCKESGGEDMVACGRCGKLFHLSDCLDFSEKLVEKCRKYNWQCGSCKRCEVCSKSDDESNVILCDACDRGYHIFCFDPPMKSRPKGEWECKVCFGESQLSGDMRIPVPTGRRKIFRYPLPTPSPRIGTPDPGTSCGKPGKSLHINTHKPNLPLLQIADVSPVSELSADVCRTEGCAGEGHLSGKYIRHSNKDSCPLYHNLSAVESKDFYTDRLRSQKASSSFDCQLDGVSHSCPDNINALRSKVNEDLRTRRAFRAELQKKHRDLHGKNREPLLDGLSTEWDLRMFRQAQSALAELKEKNTNLQNPWDTQVRMIRFGDCMVGTWYGSPFPDGMDKHQCLYFCEFCLKYMNSETVLDSHMAKCTWYHPPGNEIYRDGKISFWEVDGKFAKFYCQNLCLLAKLFLDHKTLYFDVEPFLFYIMTEMDSRGCHIIGYFSKEKKSVMNCNVSCILTLPQHQRKGFGRLLIEFSYLLSRIECKIGSPERPLSDMGLLTYRNYWHDVIMEHIADMEDGDISIKDLSQETGIHPNDVVTTLQYTGMVKYWKGEYWIYKKKDQMNSYANKRNKLAKMLHIKKKCLKWTPHPDTKDG